MALGFAASRFLKSSSSRRYQIGDDRSSAGRSVDDATWVTGAPSTSTPADNGSETPFTQADVVAPAVGSNPSATLVDPNGPPVEVYALSAFDQGPRPGTFQSCGIRNRFDYVLVSHDLAGLVVGGSIERRGLWGNADQRQPAGPLGRHPQIIGAHQAASGQLSVETAQRGLDPGRAGLGAVAALGLADRAAVRVVPEVGHA